MKNPHSIIMIGRTAAGKTTLAKELSTQLNMKYLSSSMAKETLKKGFAIEECFDENLRDQAYQKAVSRAVTCLADGTPFIIDASFHRQKRRVSLYKQIREMTSGLIIVYCYCNDIKKVELRIKDRKRSPHLVHNRACSMDTYHHIDKNFEELNGGEFPKDFSATIIQVDTDQNIVSGLNYYGANGNNNHVPQITGIINSHLYKMG